jgi:hypothetical protein
MTNYIAKNIVSIAFFLFVGFGPSALGADGDLLVTKVKDGLYAAAVKTAQGQVFYLGMEEISTPSIYRFWSSYNQATKTTGKEILGSFACNGFPRYKKDADAIFSSISQQIVSSPNQFDVHRQLNNYNLFRTQERQIEPGLIGFKEFLRAAAQEEKVAYMVYAQRKPVTGFAYEMFTPTNNWNTHVQHLHQYKNLLLSFGVLTGKNSISVTHMGIFKNPTSFTNIFPKISVTLHGFAAYCMKNVWDPSKTLQVNRPAEAMVNLLRLEFPDAVLAKVNTIEHEELNRLDHCPVVEENPILSIDLDLLQTAFIKNAIKPVK